MLLFGRVQTSLALLYKTGIDNWGFLTHLRD